jgi:hypothetical protein
MNYYTVINILNTVTALGFFTAIILSYYFYLRFRNKERIALIERGVELTEIFKSRDFSFKFPWLRLGILILGIGFGICFAYLFTIKVPTHLNPNNIRGSMQLIFMSSILIFGGLGIIIGNILERSGNKKNG